ncbi:MAG: hypothetical protein DI580_02165 [Cutibacterium acnes]|nr:MAG: hypothetical protein DI580_02165 [Cutibacterium acnes]
MSSKSNATSLGITLELYKVDKRSHTITGPRVSPQARLRENVRTPKQHKSSRWKRAEYDRTPVATVRRSAPLPKPARNSR